MLRRPFACTAEQSIVTYVQACTSKCFCLFVLCGFPAKERALSHLVFVTVVYGSVSDRGLDS